MDAYMLTLAKSFLVPTVVLMEKMCKIYFLWIQRKNGSNMWKIRY
jgi:hypothetical protein